MLEPLMQPNPSRLKRPYVTCAEKHPGEAATELGWATLDRLAAACGDAYFLLDLASFRRNFERFEEAFSARYPRSSVAYSYKTNYTPLLCREVDRLGGYGEVVSAMELELALRIGVDPRRIIFNGPLKSARDLRLALRAGVTVNLDTLDEVEEVERLATSLDGPPLRVGLRCNLPVGERVSRFGFDTDSVEFDEVVERLGDAEGCVLAGLHCHVSTGERSTASYRERTMRLLDVAARCFPDEPPAFLNLGGGYFSRMRPELRRQFPGEVPEFDDYAEAIAGPMAEAYPAGEPELILEPGSALVGDVVDFVARVVAVKQVRAKSFAVTAGSIHNIRPTLHAKQLPMRVVRPKGRGPAIVGAPRAVTDVVGYTCMEHDCLYPAWPEELQPGDFAVFANVGAYTVVMQPPFIRTAPAIVAHEGSIGFHLARGPQRFDDVFGSFALDAGSAGPTESSPSHGAKP